MKRFLCSRSVGIAFCLCMITSPLVADKVKVYNMTDKDVAVAAYHVTKIKPHTGTQTAGIIVIAPQEVVEVDRPSLKLLYDSELFFAPTEKRFVLKATLSTEEAATFWHINIGRSKGFDVYIYSDEKGVLRGSTALLKGIKNRVFAAASKPFSFLLQKKQVSIAQNSNAKVKVTVCAENDLHRQRS